VRVRDSGTGCVLDVDYTARQFHNLEWPPAPEHQDLPCPLIWPADGRHPVCGSYATLRELQPDTRG